MILPLLTPQSDSRLSPPPVILLPSCVRARVPSQEGVRVRLPWTARLMSKPPISYKVDLAPGRNRFRIRYVLRDVLHENAPMAT